VYPTVFLIHFVSAAVILLASPTLVVQFSLPYNRARVTPDFSLYSTDSLDVYSYLFTSVCSHSIITGLLSFLFYYCCYLMVKIFSRLYSNLLIFSFCSLVASSKGCVLLTIFSHYTFNLKDAYSGIFSCYIHMFQYFLTG
jgi:hypothetical protein